jgi:replication factor C subunit 2/4
MFQIPWIEKYRPTKLNNIIDHDDIIKTLKCAIKNCNIPHLLFYGSPGTGKTTTILAIARELFGPKNFSSRVLELNASDERGINMVRNNITAFVKSSISQPDPEYPSPPYKLLILDEADAMTIDAQTALRKIIENYSNITRFCIICNYNDKIIAPITSRCIQFKFSSLSKKNINTHLKKIAEKENLILSDEIFNIITNISQGDLRKSIGILQNVKYFQNISPITPDILYSLEGDVPDKLVNELIEKIKNKNNKIINIADCFYSNSYPIKNLCSKIIYIFKENKIIVFKLIKILKLLNEGSCDYIQLVNIISTIRFN